MQETTMRWKIDLGKQGDCEPTEEVPPGLSLGELLYRVLFGDEWMEPAGVA
jgi:hypothetical protein